MSKFAKLVSIDTQGERDALFEAAKKHFSLVRKVDITIYEYYNGEYTGSQRRYELQGASFHADEEEINLFEEVDGDEVDGNDDGEAVEGF